MTELAVLMIVPAYAVVASWAIGFGQARLWVTAAIALVLVVLGAIVMGRVYSVPDPPRLLLAAVMLTGPIILLPTILLAQRTSYAPRLSSRLGRAMIGAVVGFACGWVAVVFVLNVW